MESFPFNLRMELKEDLKWTVGLTSLEVYNSVSNTTEK